VKVVAEFIVPEYTAVIRRCKPKLEKMCWVPDENSLLALGPDYFATLAKVPASRKDARRLKAAKGRRRT
jgi:hypothetical protein